MDPIAEMLTQIRNSLMAGQKTCVVRYSKIKEEILKILKNEEYIRDYKIEERLGKKNIRVSLSFDRDNKSSINRIKRISKPGRRIYMPYTKLPYILRGMGMLVLSTSKGLMTDKNARKEKIGGEIICEIY